MHEKKEIKGISKSEAFSINPWAPRVFDKRPDLFKEKLKLEGYTEEVFDNIRSTVNFKGFIEYVEKNISDASLSKGLKYFKEVQNKLDKPELVEFIYPFALYAINDIEEYFKNNMMQSRYNWTEIKQSLVDTLANELINLAAKSIVLELQIENLREELDGKDSEERFANFIKKWARNDKKLIEFYTEYIVLTRTLILRTEFFINNIKEILNHIEKDWLELNITFTGYETTLERIELGLGDTHQRGKTVVKLHFSKGTTVIYKPKNLDVTLKYNDLIKWLQKKNENITLPTYKTLSFKDHSYDCFITYQECKSKQEVKNYYNKFGQLIALMYMINGADMHYENIIAHGSDPYLIDLETVFHQYPVLDFDDTAELKLKYEQTDSVLGSGLLPQSLFQNSDGKGIDLSAFNGHKQSVPFKVLQIENRSTDKMIFKKKEAFTEEANNIPMINGNKINGRLYYKEILNGFLEMINTFKVNKSELIDGPIKEFGNCTIRIIVRATQQYSDFITESTHPDYNRDAYALEEMLERMWFYPFKDRRTVPFEIKDMLNKDVPFFTTTIQSKDLFSSEGDRIPNYFEASGFDLVKEKILNLSEEQIMEQSRYLLLSIAPKNVQDKDIKLVKKSLMEPSISTLQAAKIIGDELLENAKFAEATQTISWMNIQENENGYHVKPMTASLYDGLSGMALFYLYLYEETKVEKYFKAAEYAMNSALQTLTKSKGLISAFFGEFSMLYPLYQFNEFYPNIKYQNKINELEKEIVMYIEKDMELDFLSGTAGLIVMYSQLYDKNKDPKIKLLIEKLVQHLEKGLNNNLLINRHVNKKLGGLSHGSSGIALAMYKAWEIFGDENYLVIAKANNDYESMLFTEGKGWLDLRSKQENYLHKWAHGTLGIGLSMLKQNKLEFLNMYETLIEPSKQSKNAINDIKLGSTELLLMLKNPANSSEDIAKDIISYISKQRDFGVENVLGFEARGLYGGIAGIGYQLLRINNPQAVPSILTLDFKA